MRPCLLNVAITIVLCLTLLGSFLQIAAESEYLRIISGIGTIGSSPGSLRVLRLESVIDLTRDQRNNASLLADILDIYVTYEWQGAIVDQIHNINSNVRVLLYRDMSVVKNGDPEWQTALDHGWLLRDSNGNLIYSVSWPTHYLVDPANQEYRNFVVGWLNNYFGQYHFDGVYADNCLKISVEQWCASVTAEPINPATGALYTDGEVRDNTISFINYVNARIGNKTWVSNGIFQGEFFFSKYSDFTRVLSESTLNGFISEGLFNIGGSDMGSNQFYSEQKWKKSVDFVSWVQDNFLNQANRLFGPSGRCGQNQIPANTTAIQVATFIFSSLLLGITKPQNYLFLVSPLSEDIQNLFKIELGFPDGTYSMLTGTHIYSRNFTRTRVLVNPTDQPYSINLGQTYETLESQIVSSVEINPHTGLILKLMTG